MMMSFYKRISTTSLAHIQSFNFSPSNQGHGIGPTRPLFLVVLIVLLPILIFIPITFFLALKYLFLIPLIISPTNLSPFIPIGLNPLLLCILIFIIICPCIRMVFSSALFALRKIFPSPASALSGLTPSPIKFAKPKFFMTLCTGFHTQTVHTGYPTVKWC